MSEELKAIADNADMIVNGYSFSVKDGLIHVLNLNKPGKASVLKADGELLETSMDDIEVQIVREYLAKNRRFLEA